MKNKYDIQEKEKGDLQTSKNVADVEDASGRRSRWRKHLHHPHTKDV